MPSKTKLTNRAIFVDGVSTYDATYLSEQYTSTVFFTENAYNHGDIIRDGILYTYICGVNECANVQSLPEITTYLNRNSDTHHLELTSYSISNSEVYIQPYFVEETDDKFIEKNTIELEAFISANYTIDDDKHKYYWTVSGAPFSILGSTYSNKVSINMNPYRLNEGMNEGCAYCYMLFENNVTYVKQCKLYSEYIAPEKIVITPVERYAPVNEYVQYDYNIYPSNSSYCYATLSYVVDGVTYDFDSEQTNIITNGHAQSFYITAKPRGWKDKFTYCNTAILNTTPYPAATYVKFLNTDDVTTYVGTTYDFNIMVGTADNLGKPQERAFRADNYGVTNDTICSITNCKYIADGVSTITVLGKQPGTVSIWINHTDTHTSNTLYAKRNITFV